MTHSKGCHGSAGMPSFRHDGALVRRDAPQYKCYTRVRHDGAIVRRDAPQYKCCTRCVMTEEIVRHDGILYKELYEYVRRDAKALRHDGPWVAS